MKEGDLRATDNFFERKREWSHLKDRILGAYLRPYLAKIVKTRRPTLLVDCFAGKGRFDDGEAGSPILICQAIDTVKRTRPDAIVNGLFIERKYASELRQNLQEFANWEVLPGTYEEHMGTIEDRVSEGTNLFLFVDPYGIKSLDMGRLRHLRELPVGSCEILMNFTTRGFLREGCRFLSIDGFDCGQDSDVYEGDPDSPNTRERMDAIAGGDYWRDILGSYYEKHIDMREAERQFSRDYLQKLRDLFEYVVDIPVQYRREHLPKYRLIYGTRKDDGLILMADNMSRAWREFVHQDRGGQEALFEEIDFPDMVALEGYSLEDDILEMAECRIGLKDLLVCLITKYGISYPEGELKRRMLAMEGAGLLIIRRDPPLTPKTRRPSTSMDYRKYRISVERNSRG